MVSTFIPFVLVWTQNHFQNQNRAGMKATEELAVCVYLTPPCGQNYNCYFYADLVSFKSRKNLSLPPFHGQIYQL